MTSNDPGPWGTDDRPLLMSDWGWEHLHPFLVERMQHVHIYRGGVAIFSCAKNRFGPSCHDGQEWDARS